MEEPEFKYKDSLRLKARERKGYILLTLAKRKLE